MPDENWVQQLSDVAVLAGFAYLATPSKPGLTNVPAVVEPSPNPVEQKPQKKKGNLSPEEQEFKRLPLNIQRQVLDYARNWLDANFERTS